MSISSAELVKVDRAAAFIGLRSLLQRVQPFANQYRAVVAEGFGAEIPTLAVSTLVEQVRQASGRHSVALGHVKSNKGPQTVHPAQPTMIERFAPKAHRVLLVTEAVQSGDTVANAVWELRQQQPHRALIDVAILSCFDGDAMGTIAGNQPRGSRLISADAPGNVGNYFYLTHDHDDADKEEAIRLGHAVAERPLGREQAW